MRLSLLEQRVDYVRDIAFSQYLQAECARYHFRYFDTSRNFMQTLDEVVAFVREA
jgi:hypothetical protein